MATARKRRSATPRTRKRSSSANRKRTASTRKRWRLLLTLVVAVVAIAFGGYNGFDYLEQLLADPGTAGQGGSVRHGDLDRARQQLSELKVAEWASMRGYSRDRFSHWRVVDGCNVRQTVLGRDGEDVRTESDSCKALTGTWFSPFDGVTLTDPSDVDIDHLVPLANAWRTGAADWDEDRRVAFANDLDTPQLIAVSARSNRAKGDQDPSQWKPPERGYWCQYAHDWVIVKHYWQLWVTAAERDALADMLDTCR